MIVKLGILGNRRRDGELQERAGERQPGAARSVGILVILAVCAPSPPSLGLSSAYSR